MSDIQTAAYAYTYKIGEHVDPPKHLIEQMRKITRKLFKTIPIKVQFCDYDPYQTLEEMAADITANNVLKVTNTYNGSLVWGDTYAMFRAVHDYFGHFLAGHAFGVTGEIRSYELHTRQFPQPLWPFIFNELVLINAYKDHYGDYFPGEKIVMIETMAKELVA